MQLAYVQSTRRGGTDLLLSAFARRCIARGMRVSGIVQINTERALTHHCDMDVQVLPSGPIHRISQNLGTEARGCRLAPEALEQSVLDVSRQMAECRPDVLILNKFGKHEADGRGFRNLIGEALAADIPVISGVNQLNLAAFNSFADGFATELPADPSALDCWVAQHGQVSTLELAV